MVFDGQEDGVEDNADHDEEVEHGVVDHYMQEVLELQPRAVVDAAIPALVAVSIHYCIFCCCGCGGDEGRKVEGMRG